jgi:hypothetical protein
MFIILSQFVFQQPTSRFAVEHYLIGRSIRLVEKGQ